MIILGLCCLLIGYLLAVPVLVTIGWVVAGIGLVLLLVTAVSGRAIGSRKYWY